MKYCSHCGTQLLDEAVVCPKCGCPTESKKPVVSENRSGLGTAARVFMIIQCVALVAFLLIIFFCNNGYSGRFFHIASEFCKYFIVRYAY